MCRRESLSEKSSLAELCDLDHELFFLEFNNEQDKLNFNPQLS